MTTQELPLPTPVLTDPPIRQGDVLLIPVQMHPDHLRSAVRHERQCTLAFGEATGHHHTLYPAAPDETEVAREVFIGDKRFIELPIDCFLRHQDHGEDRIAKGTYEIVIKEEYDIYSRAMRRVVD